MSFSLIELLAGRDEFPVLVSYIDKNALYAFSFTCKAALKAVLDLNEPINTSYTSIASSVALIEWAIGLGCPLKEQTWLSVAGKEGNLDVLRWVNDKDLKSVDWVRVFNKAARGGHLHVLEWIFEEKYIYMSGIYKCAVEGGHVNVLQWARKKRIWSDNGRDDCDYSLSYIAAREGDHATLEWLRNNDFDWERDTCSGAASGGHLETLKWLRAEGCEWGSSVYTCAAENGNLPILKWASENGLTTENTDVCAYFAKEGNLEMLQWARANGFPWGYYTIRWAALNNKLEILKWAHANGCTSINTRSFELYGNDISSELISWFKENLE